MQNVYILWVNDLLRLGFQTGLKTTSRRVATWKRRAKIIILQECYYSPKNPQPTIQTSSKDRVISKTTWVISGARLRQGEDWVRHLYSLT